MSIRTLVAGIVIACVPSVAGAAYAAPVAQPGVRTLAARAAGPAPTMAVAEAASPGMAVAQGVRGDTLRVGRDAPRVPGGLVPGDLIKLRIWREPDLSGEFQVDGDGVVVFPKIGAQRVTGESQEALRARLVALYSEYLRNPSIEVTILRRINVLGAVREPGLIPVDPTMVVADVIALAGGTMPDARNDRIRLIRDGEVLTADISQRTRIADLPLQSGDQLYVPEKGWLRRSTGTFVSAGVSLVTVLITLALTR